MSSGVFPRFIKTLWQTCWAGVLVLLPATVTIYILWRLFTALEEVAVTCSAHSAGRDTLVSAC